MDKDLFSADTNQQADNQHDPDPASYVEYATSKFKNAEGKLDIEALARGKYESDRFIQKLQNEQAELRKDLETRLALEAYLEKTIGKGMSTNTPSNTNQSDNLGNDEPGNGEPANKGLNEEAIAALIKKTLSQETQKATQDKNINTVRQEMEKVWGKDYSSKLATKAEELGVGKEFLNRLAMESPKAFLSVMGVEAKSQVNASVFTPPQTGVRSTTTEQVGVRNKAYYDQLKKSNPGEFWRSNTQAQMHKDALRLGEAFFNT